MRGPRIFYTLLVGSALAVVAIVTVAVVLVWRYLHAPDPIERVRAKYQLQYDRCVSAGTAPTACGDTVFDACEKDPYFAKDSNATSDISSVYYFP